MPGQERRARSTEAFFGRRRGKALRPRQAELLETHLPALLVDISGPSPQNIADLFGHAPRRVTLEIGFGGGEHLLHRARQDPDAGFIGVEPFVNSMAKFVSSAVDAQLTNVRIYDDDATQLLDWLPDACLDGIDLLYPDPWPKKKHWKRRFLNPVNLDRFARVMKPGALFRFASDIDSYVNWTLNLVHAHPEFTWLARSAADWRKPYDGWPGTRYEAKALREGRTPAYLTFRRK
jgi:tRNA (guanine-N7-)-methyltransferase